MSQFLSITTVITDFINHLADTLIINAASNSLGNYRRPIIAKQLADFTNGLHPVPKTPS